jgi:hypothetical protein
MKGILMTRSNLELTVKGLKTQTRRIINPQPLDVPEGAYLDRYNKTDDWCFWMPKPDNRMVNSIQGDRKDSCMFHSKYLIGEIVYLKEAYRVVGKDSTINNYRDVPLDTCKESCYNVSIDN